MKHITPDQLNELTNALQLCLKNEIKGSSANASKISIQFNAPVNEDGSFTYFDRLVKGTWNGGTCYTFDSEVSPPLSVITNFLLLSRLQKENILKLGEMNADYRELVLRIFADSTFSEMNLPQIQSVIFTTLQKKDMTLRQLADQSGLSMVSISNFKAGKDIRLSNLIKIISALDLKLKIE